LPHAINFVGHIAAAVCSLHHDDSHQALAAIYLFVGAVGTAFDERSNRVVGEHAGHIAHYFVTKTMTDTRDPTRWEVTDM
jgi:hypothetical protein